jgi:hypothetical protein
LCCRYFILEQRWNTIFFPWTSPKGPFGIECGNFNLFNFFNPDNGFYFSSGFQFRDGNCRENLCNFFSLRSENVISRPLWACPEERNVAQNFHVPKLKTRLSLTGFLFTRRKVGAPDNVVLPTVHIILSLLKLFHIGFLIYKYFPCDEYS